MPKPFRFGVQAKVAESASVWKDLARKAEDLGYSTLTVSDHFDGQLAPVPALQAVADATSYLRIGALVLANDYRHPVLLASEMATLDLLSDGRLEIGLGAGWMLTDYAAAGIPLDPPGVRIERMVETVQILDGLFGDVPFTFEGKHYTITDLDLVPKPVQRPRPPLLIGGGGPRMLREAGRYADIVGVNSNLRSGVFGTDAIGDGTAENVDQKMGWVAEGAGDRFDEIELQARVHFVVFAGDRAGTAEFMASAVGLTGEQALGSPFALIGDVDSMVDDLLSRRERFGFSYLTVGLEVLDEFAPVVARLSGT